MRARPDLTRSEGRHRLSYRPVAQRHGSIAKESPRGSVSRILDEVADAGRGMIMVMGKGGVGKTTIAAAVAVDLASRGLPVHFSTTHPAAHVAETLGGEVPKPSSS